jgi:hypothetical protein
MYFSMPHIIWTNLELNISGFISWQCGIWPKFTSWWVPANACLER